MSEKPDWILKLEAEPCSCVPCRVCKGTAMLWFNSKGEYVGLAPNNFATDTSRPCDACSGGAEAVCERCAMLKTWEELEPVKS